jgi:hypothetical protein
MGFHFRKRNPKGLNVSLSKRGLRVSKTIKMGGVSFNIGRYFGGSSDGKTAVRTRLNFGNGLMYTKHKTLSPSKEDQERTNRALNSFFQPSNIEDTESYCPNVYLFSIFFFLTFLTPVALFYGLNDPWFENWIKNELLGQLFWRVSLLASLLGPAILQMFVSYYSEIDERFQYYTTAFFTVPTVIYLFFGLFAVWVYISEIYTWYKL